MLDIKGLTFTAIYAYMVVAILGPAFIPMLRRF